MLYYINFFYLYSLFGFILESTVFKISKSKKYSGICYGPYTFVYGFGIVTLTLVKEYFLDKLKINKYLKILVTFITCTIVLTIIEYIGGNILRDIFGINMWNYTKKTYNFGKYICLELAITWGALGTLYVYHIKKFLDKFIELIPKKLTIFIIIVNSIDIVITLINKL